MHQIDPSGDPNEQLSKLLKDIMVTKQEKEENYFSLSADSDLNFEIQIDLEQGPEKAADALNQLTDAMGDIIGIYLLSKFEEGTIDEDYIREFAHHWQPNPPLVRASSVL